MHKTAFFIDNYYGRYSLISIPARSCFYLRHKYKQPFSQITCLNISICKASKTKTFSYPRVKFSVYRLSLVIVRLCLNGQQQP